MKCYNCICDLLKVWIFSQKSESEICANSLLKEKKNFSYRSYYIILKLYCVDSIQTEFELDSFSSIIF